MTDNNNSTNSPACRVAKTRNENVNETIQNKAKENEKAEKRKCSNSGQRDIKEYFSNNICDALSLVDDDEEEDNDDREAKSTASSNFLGKNEKMKEHWETMILISTMWKPWNLRMTPDSTPLVTKRDELKKTAKNANWWWQKW